MKVKELIERLQKMNPEIDVVIRCCTDSSFHYVENVWYSGYKIAVIEPDTSENVYPSYLDDD